MGPIPWNRIVEYGLRAELEPDIQKAFEATMRAMDNAYLEWMGKQADRNKQGSSDGESGSKSLPGPSGRKLRSRKGRGSK